MALRGSDALGMCLKEGRGEPEWGTAARSCALRDGVGPSVREAVSRSRPRSTHSVPSP